MDSRDENIRLGILKEVYEEFHNNPPRVLVSNHEIAETLDVELDDINYILDRIDGESIDVQSYLGGRKDAEITAKGIEFLSSQGHNTLLDSKTRYNILQILYKTDREQRHSLVNIDKLKDETDAEEAELLRNIEYLKQMNCVELHGGYSTIQITNHGRERHEKYRDDGIGIPSTASSESTMQAEIGKGETQKAENLFRDIVELAETEIVILDRYAKQGLFNWIDKHVPAGVQIRVLTSGRVTGGSYTKDIKQPLSTPSDVEVRELPNSDWDFHDRYIFRDDEMGWSWGHSFHDSGDRQHTANELKPINRDTILQKFESAWKQASQVI